MPLFEYKCDDCGHRFEELVSGNNPKVVCPKCDSNRVKKQLSVFSSSNASSTSSSSSKCSGGCGGGYS